MKKLWAYDWLLIAGKVGLLLVLLGFLAIWVAYTSPAGFMAQVATQRGREQRIVKNALVLAYRTDPRERAVALAELQDVLPIWEQVQKGLLVGDRSLGLPRNIPGNIVFILASANTDYVPLDVAARKILVQHNPVDPLQVQILIDHDRGYSNALYQVTLLWQQHIDDVFLQLYFIETGLVGGVLLLVLAQFLFVTRPALKEINTLNARNSDGILKREIKEEGQPPPK